MGMLPEGGFAEHDHPAPDWRIADLESLSRRRPVLQKSLDDQATLI